MMVDSVGRLLVLRGEALSSSLMFSVQWVFLVL